jgi:vancomycin resistance protein YoaR
MRDAARAWLVGILLALAVVTAGGVAAARRWWPLVLVRCERCALPGVRVDGLLLRPRVDARTQIDRQADELESRVVRLVDAGRGGAPTMLRATLRELGITVDTEAVLRRALRLGRHGGAWRRAEDAERARRGEIDVPLDPAIDTGTAAARLSLLKEELDGHAIAARLDLEGHRVIPERDGRALDLGAAAAAILHAARTRDDVVALPFVSVRSPITSELLARIDVHRSLGAYDTYFSRSGDQAPRARNIEVAAGRLDGLVVAPRAVVSFNDVVGPRSEENGFVKAFEIFKGEFVEGRGGGTCQVASTLYAAAFFAGLDVIERLPHSRPSPYIPVGLDATVAYPTVDLKLRNAFDFPVVFRARTLDNQLHIEVLGADKPVSVELRKEVLTTTPFDRKVVEEGGLADPKRTQKGLDGMDLRRSRVLAFRGGASRTETSVDRYPATEEVWKVPPGYDRSQLPPLGEDPDASAAPDGPSSGRSASDGGASPEEPTHGGEPP